MKVTVPLPDVVPATLLPEVGTELIRILDALEVATLSEEQRVHARDIIGHLLKLDGMRRLTPSFLKLALEAVQGKVHISARIEPLVQIAAQHCAALERQTADRVELASRPSWADHPVASSRPRAVVDADVPATRTGLVPACESPQVVIRTGT